MTDEIQAAHIAAQAAIHSAWIQGALTVVTGFLALLAGGFAYRGALRAAGRQVQLEEEKHEARVAAYRFRIGALTTDLEKLAGDCLIVAISTLASFRENDGGSDPIPVLPLSPIPDLSEEHWESHALLGESAVRAIYNVNSRLRRYISFQREVLQEGLTSNQMTKHSSPSTSTEEKDGLFEIHYPHAAVVNEILARALAESIKELRSVISRNPRRQR